MPVRTTYPGVYIEEVPSGVRTITGVATAVTAFVGYTARGRDNVATRLLSYADYEREFGGLASDSELSYAVSHYYKNGGGEAWVVRVPREGSVTASITVQDKLAAGPKSALKITALASGEAANGLLIDVYHDNTADDASYYLTIQPRDGAEEKFLVSQDESASNYVELVVNDPERGSQFVRVEVPDTDARRPVQTGTSGSDIPYKNGLPDLALPLKIEVVVDTGDPATSLDVVDVPILDAGETIPSSVLGLARLVEQRVNAAIAKQLAGAAIRCEPNENGKGLRAWAEYDQEKQPGTADAVLTFKGTGNLKLNVAATDANVGYYVLGQGRVTAAVAASTKGVDGNALPGATALLGSRSTNPPTGVFALEKVDLFNLLCLPDATRAEAGKPTVAAIDENERLTLLGDALRYCRERRAFLILDPPPGVDDIDSAGGWIANELTALRSPNAAAYFPRVRLADPLNRYANRLFAPSGVIAGLYARTDGTAGVWKAPAGTEAKLEDVRGFEYPMTDAENGVLNPLGLNALRGFRGWGNVSWGARTLVGADESGSEWKYVPVRRLALYLEESLYRGTKWAVFEPNDEPLWAQLRLNVGSFMHSLFRQGAFAGKSARDAYLVKCDRETTTPADVDRGVVNILVMFAPLKPAEFVVIRIQQMAGQLQV